MRPLLCLTMILKDEAHCVQKTLDSVKNFVDCWRILDTGSTDNTQAVVCETMRGLPGRLDTESFRDFATSRNCVLDIASIGSGGPETTPIFTLMLSADETLSGGPELRAFLEEQRSAKDGAYSVTMSAENARWFYPRVLRVDAGWRYVGEVHEVPLGPGGETHGVPIPGAVITHRTTDPERRTRRLREFDLPMLTRMAGDEARSLTARAQAVWFLAQTYESLADSIERVPGGEWVVYKMAAMAHYWRRTEIGGVLGGADDAFKTH